MEFSRSKLHSLLLGLSETDRKWQSFFRSSQNEEKIGLLRIDVDYDLHLASEMAEIIAEYNLSATFFIRLDAEYYNIFAPTSLDQLSRIHRSNHWIGLHHQASEDSAEKLLMEFEVLERLVPTERVVSWHNPPENLSSLSELAENAGLLSAYDPKFFGPDRYVSDSNMARNNVAILERVTACQEPSMQVLIHPLIWLLGGDAMHDALGHLLRWREKITTEAFKENAAWANHLDKRNIQK